MRVWIALAVNAALIIALLWSRGGQTVTVRVEASATEVAVIVDGREFARTQTLSTAGGPVIYLDGSEDVWLPGLAQPSRVLSVRVADLDTGEALYSWRAGDDIPEATRIFLRPALDLSQQPWTDYAVTVRYANPTGGAIAVHEGSEAPALFAFKRYDRPTMYLQSTDPRGDTQAIGTNRVELDRSEGVSALIAAALAPYPRLALAVLLLFALSALAGRYLHLPTANAGRYFDSVTPYAASACLLFAFVATSLIFARYGQRMPHIVDETSYVFQANVLASGRAHVDPPPIPEAFAFWNSPFIFDYEGRWASFYPFGHPLVLAAGAEFGVMWLVPALVGTATIALVFVLARKLHSTATGLIAALLMATSPFVLMQASTYMSHNTAALYLLAALCAVLLPGRRRVAGAAAAGVLFGLLFNTRPFTAVALAPWFAVLIAYPLLRARARVEALRVLAFCAGSLAMLGAYFAYNFATTGSFNNGYQEGGDLGAALGFGGAHSVALGLENHQALLGTLVAVLDGWPAFVGLALVLLPFALGTRRWTDWWMLGASVTVMGAWILYKSSGIAHGPRYWYEVAPLLFILSGRGATLAVERAASIGARLAPGVPDARQQARVVSGLAVGVVIGGLCAWSVYAWLFGQHRQWEYFTTAAEPREMRISFDDRLHQAAEAAGVTDALVLVAPCGEFHLCYQSVFWRNDPDLDGDVVYANDLGDRNGELFALYPCRNLYAANYADGTITSRGRTPPPPGGACGD